MRAPDVTSLLREVSRSFYLTLRVLPAAVRPQIGLAYLLARTTDTVADTAVISLELRLQALDQLRARILGQSSAPLHFGPLAQTQSSPAEKTLLERVEESLRLLEGCAPADQRRIRRVLDIIISGQALDLQRFAAASAQNIVALPTDAELEDYTYRVAGCVGEFWSEMCLAHLFQLPAEDEAAWRENGVRFGQGLQLVNIVRDLPVDLRQGRCYLPVALAGIAPGKLLEAGFMGQFRPLYDTYLERAQGHLAAGWEYTNVLPRSQARLRLACAWPILIGARTLGKLRGENVLDPARRIKVSRSEIYQIMARSALLYPADGLWRRQFDDTAKPVASHSVLR
ncbi:MAG TPA: phytoene/squalene synthase family protein [Verrucomicrobiae bacterium]|jgi:farnesyl-diphosphate farnesyltransferase|nr:phytoene/squalene synthase family protein [Verrucomicrobiae bacterium]